MGTGNFDLGAFKNREGPIRGLGPKSLGQDDEFI